MAAPFSFCTDEGTQRDEAREALAQSKVPTVFTSVGEVEDLCAEIFRWEIATCLGGALLESNLFDATEGQGS